MTQQTSHLRSNAELPTSSPTGFASWDFRRVGSGWAVGAITLLAVFLRIHAITAKSLWLDEGMSIAIARLSWPQFAHVMWSREANMALYYLLLRFWILFGSGEGFIRGLSVLFSAATVPLVFFLGSRLFGRGAGVLAALLLAMNAYHIRYAQEARGYALVVFFAVLATWLLAKNLQEPASVHWKTYGFVCALAAYSHFFGALLIVAHGISLLFWQGGPVPWRKFTLSLLIFGAMMVPIAIFVSRAGAAPLSWVPPLQSGSLLSLGVQFAGNYGRLLLALYTFAIGMAAIMASRAWRNKDRTSEGWGYTLVLAWMLVPLALVLVISVAKPIFFPRFLSFCLPALILAASAGLSRLKPAALAWALCIAILVCALLGDRNYYSYDFDLDRQDWRTVTGYVLAHAQPHDSIFFYYGAGAFPFRYYSEQSKSAAFKPANLQEYLVGGQERLDAPAGETQFSVTVPGTNLRAAPPTGNRVWLVLLFLSGSREESDTGKAVRKWLLSGRSQVDTQQFLPLAVVLFERSSSSQANSSQSDIAASLQRR